MEKGSKKTDLRIRRTYLSLENAFIELTKVKKPEDITIGELCDKAMVGRATFYKHFEDKYDFLVKLINMKSEEFFSNKVKEKDFCNEEGRSELMQATFDFVDEHYSMVEAMIKSNMMPVLMDIINKDISEKIQFFMRHNLKDTEITDREYIIGSQLIIGALIQIVKFWITNHDQYSKEELLESLNGFVGLVERETQNYIKA